MFNINNITFEHCKNDDKAHLQHLLTKFRQDIPVLW